jgi:hypothetical protein
LALYGQQQGQQQKQIPPLRCGMTSKEQAAARAKANTEILASPE